MSWIEIIHLRNSDSALLAVMEDFINSLRSNIEREGMSAFNVYLNVTLPEDISIHLCWSGRPPTSDESVVGRRIAY